LSKFRLNIVIDHAIKADIETLIPPFEKGITHFINPSQMKYSIPDLLQGNLNLIWVDQSMLKSLYFLFKQNNHNVLMENTVLIGSKLNTADAIQLGNFGFSRFYQLDDQSELIVEIILKQYEIWQNSISKPVKKVDIDEIIIGESPPVNRLKKLIQKVAEREKLMILIRGETGTGKGLVAQMLHLCSPRSEKAFVEINCTAIPDGLIEAELFGHEKGAFTDAHRSRRGIFEMAHEGTLFLDEIGYLKKEVQVKLLKVLEDRKFRRVGGEKDIQVDCRIITGTSVDLESMVEKKEFRQDLFYRLNVFPIIVPPLRDRGNDILRLAEHFRKYFCREHGISNSGFDNNARKVMLESCWDGNVRELKHSIERAVILSEDKLISVEALSGVYVDSSQEISRIKSSNDDLSTEIGTDTDNMLRIVFPDQGKSMSEIQREIIEQVLELTESNKSEAARLLKISRSRLLRRIDTQADDSGQ